ncbi:GNAT family N-acetyltransferase [Paenibacillus sp. KN14-4R]|uniref:GNAT family N-acetyltransferase n=1 Tax=Paenibacillus sp. KN14-4R TaxID=3445773 RepID=UPI003FA0C0D6
MFSYRDSKKEDFDYISKFPQNKTELFYMFPKGLYPADPEQLYQTSQTRQLATVIEYEEEIVGYCNLYGLVEGEHCWLGNVIINPRFRGQGAGEYLVNLMLERARNELNVKELRLVCHNINTKALLLYYKIGFKPYDMKIISDPDNNQIAGIIMRMEVD